MKKFTIRCSIEQTQKAIQIGAPLDATTGTDQDEISFNYDGVSYIIPTAEQMTGWLSELLDVEIWHINQFAGGGFGYTIIACDAVFELTWTDDGKHCKSTYNEAIMASIDAVLDYLVEQQTFNPGKYTTSDPETASHQLV